MDFRTEFHHLRVAVIPKTFNLNADNPLNPKHPQAKEIQQTIGELIHNPKASFNPVRDQWNYVGPCKALPDNLKAARNGRGWVLPNKAKTKMGYTLTPTDLHGQPKKFHPTLTQVRTQAFVYLDEREREIMGRILTRTFQRTYGQEVLKVHNHPKFGTPDENSLFPLAEFSWAYVETRVPLKYRPAFVTLEDIGDDSEAMGLLGTTLWQEPMLNFDLVAPHRGCPYCHSLGHGHKACDALYRHRRWLKHTTGVHPLETDVQTAVRQQPNDPEEDEDDREDPSNPTKAQTPKVIFVPMQSRDEGLENGGPEPKRTKYARQAFTVPEGIPVDVYNALQTAYTVVNEQERLQETATAVITLLRKNSIFPPDTDSRGSGLKRQVEALCMVLRDHMIPSCRKPCGRGTNIENYFSTLINKNPFKESRARTTAEAKPAAAAQHGQTSMTQFVRGTSTNPAPENDDGAPPKETATGKRKNVSQDTATSSSSSAPSGPPNSDPPQGDNPHSAPTDSNGMDMSTGAQDQQSSA